MCEACEWSELCDKINALLDDDNYDWASDTLSGILETVTDRSHATRNQITAIENIERGGKR